MPIFWPLDFQTVLFMQQQHDSQALDILSLLKQRLMTKGIKLSRAEVCEETFSCCNRSGSHFELMNSDMVGEVLALSPLTPSTQALRCQSYEECSMIMRR